MSSYSAQFQDQLSRRRSAADSRQRFLDLIYAQELAEQRKQAAETTSQESRKKLNWFDDASKGAQMGSIAGGWGALAGAILGTVKGQVESYKERRRLGEGRWNAFTKTHADTPFGFNMGKALSSDGWARGKFEGDNYNSLREGALENLIAAGANSRAHYQQNKARTSTATGGTLDAYPELSNPGSADGSYNLSTPSLGDSTYGNPYQGTYTGAGLRNPNYELPKNFKLRSGYGY